jgi:hypothetical protein
MVPPMSHAERNVLLGVLFFATALCAAQWVFARQSAGIPPPDKDPFVGTWKPNTDKSRPKLSAREARTKWIESREGAERIFRLEGRSESSRTLCDGEPHTEGDPVITAAPPGKDYVVCRYVTPNRIEGETGTVIRDSGRPFFSGSIDYWTLEISPDGQQMSVTHFKDKPRIKVAMIWVLDRVQGP